MAFDPLTFDLLFQMAICVVWRNIRLVIFLRHRYSHFFWQRPWRGRCPVEHRGTFVCSFIWDLRLKFQPLGLNPSLEAQIPASRLKSQPQGSNLHTRMDRQMDKQTNKRTNESPPVFYRTSSPSGPLPCYPSATITNIPSRATGIADHILPLGDLFPLFLGSGPEGDEVL